MKIYKTTKNTAHRRGYPISLNLRLSNEKGPKDGSVLLNSSVGLVS